MPATAEIHRGGAAKGGPTVCAAHPSDVFGPQTAELLGEVAQAEVVCVNAHGVGSLEEMVDRIEQARRAQGFGPWVFWGMSGGGFLAQIYAHRYPEALAGMVVESCCACFRLRVADEACVMSPRFPAWREAIRAAGLFDERAHEAPAGGPAEWLALPGLGHVLRRPGGPALLIAPEGTPPPMREVLPLLYRFDSRSWLPSLRTPALVIAGSADPVAPVPHVRAVHEALGDRSAFLLVEGGGHVPTAQRDPSVAQAYQAFARRLSPARSS